MSGLAPARRILIIDDDPDIVFALTAILEDAGYDVRTASRADDLPHARPHDMPQLILLDMLLSGQDGRDIARRLKSQEATRHIPIMMLSAHPNAEREAAAAGADGFLGKPFELETLLAKVEILLR